MPSAARGRVTGPEDAEAQARASARQPLGAPARSLPESATGPGGGSRPARPGPAPPQPGPRRYLPAALPAGRGLGAPQPACAAPRPRRACAPARLPPRRPRLRVAARTPYTPGGGLLSARPPAAEAAAPILVPAAHGKL